MSSNLKYFRSGAEVAIMALFAVVISFLCSTLVFYIRHKKMPTIHSFNDDDLFINSFFTALLATVIARTLNFRAITELY